MISASYVLVKLVENGARHQHLFLVYLTHFSVSFDFSVKNTNYSHPIKFTDLLFKENLSDRTVQLTPPIQLAKPCSSAACRHGAPESLFVISFMMCHLVLDALIKLVLDIKVSGLGACWLRLFWLLLFVKGMFFFFS